MNYTILISASLALGCLPHLQATEYTFTTQNGYYDRAPDGTVLDSSLYTGSYTGVSFVLHASHYASDPTGSLTTTVDSDGFIPAKRPESFDTGQQVSLASIEILAPPSSHFENVAGLRIVAASDPSESISGSLVSTEVRTTHSDPWLDPAISVGRPVNNNVATFTFGDSPMLTVGVTYNAYFIDAAGNPVETTILLTKYGADGFAPLGTHVCQDDKLSPAGMKITTESLDTDVIPEPSTASLSLLALAGFMYRRRRRDVKRR